MAMAIGRMLVNALTVIFALACAVSNAASTVFQRRAHVDESDEGRGDDAKSAFTRLLRPLRAPFWWVGTAGMVSGAVFQVLALDSGSLAVVQPLLASELLFALLIGTAVFHERPSWATWVAFAMLGSGLAGFLIVASPEEGSAQPSWSRWLAVIGGVALFTSCAILMASHVAGAMRSASLGIATAAGFATTAAFIKEMTRGFSAGPTAVLTTWPLYAAAMAGLGSMLLLQWTLRAGTLTASQPALTLGDALISVALGAMLFEEQIALGWRLLPEALAMGLVAAGVIGITQTPAARTEEAWDDSAQK